MKAFKIRVGSLEHSRKIQEKLFQLGYEWLYSGKTLSFLSSPFLYFKYNYEFITMGGTEEYFISNSSKEVKLVEKISYDITHSSKEVKLVEKISYEFEEIEERKVVKVGEISYYEDELADALKNIKPIE